MWRSSGVLLAGALALLVAGAAAADIYRWTDENGQLHVTSNADEVPLRFRNQQSGTPSGTVNKMGADGPTAARNTPAANRLQDLRRMNRETPKEPNFLTDIHPKAKAPEPPPPIRYETKCNSKGDCRRYQTPEFKQWKVRQKMDAQAEAAAGEDD
jgi:hypothetical protein